MISWAAGDDSLIPGGSTTVRNPRGMEISNPTNTSMVATRIVPMVRASSLATARIYGCDSDRDGSEWSGKG